MPIYDYQCAACGHRFELRQGFDADPVEVCPQCQGQARRRFHSVAVIYKGSGFYTTDYARKRVNTAGDSSDGDSSDTSSEASSTSSGKSDDKSKAEVKTSEE